MHTPSSHDTEAKSNMSNSIENLQSLASKVRFCVDVNTNGISDTESLVSPQPEGNSMNWVVGHLTVMYNKLLPMFGEQPVVSMDRLARYDRGSAPIENGSEAIPFTELLAAWKKSAELIDTGLTRIPTGMLAQPVPDSPTGNPKETIESLLFTMMFHQAYHSGQLGVLRRVAGKEGAIK